MPLQRLSALLGRLYFLLTQINVAVVGQL